jgi:iron(III) transport system substrate-binding protein
MISRFRSIAFAMAWRAALLAACLMGAGARAQGPTPERIALYSGPDRPQVLAEGARKEGTLTLYTSLNPEDLGALSADFERRYGVKLRAWRASSENISQRVIAETRAGRFEFDAIETNGSILESFQRAGLLREVRSPHLAGVIPEALRPHREWVGTRVNVFAQAYHTGLIMRGELPRSYQDLLDPRWKGKLGIEASDFDWFAGVVQALGEAQALTLFRGIVARNGISVRKGHTLLSNLVGSGEVPLALTVYHYRVEQMKQKGAPIDWFIIPPAIAHANGVAVSRKAPHPYASVLFYDYMLGEGEEILRQREVLTTKANRKSLLSAQPVRFADPGAMLDEHDKWSRLYSEIITRQAR